MRIQRWRVAWLGALLCALTSVPWWCGAEEPTPSVEQPIEVKVQRFYDPNYPDQATTKRLIQLMQTDPQIHVEQWGGLSLPGGAGRAPLMMAIAGKTAPDIMESWFHIVGNDIHQGFLYPLNEWIGDDLDGNGFVDPDEAKWDKWKDIPPLWRQVVTRDGKVYGIPQAMKYYMGVIFRSDMVRKAGLDPAKPPTTWDELTYWCEKLTDPSVEVPGAVIAQGQRGIALVPYGFTWLPWLQSAGGDPIVQVRTSPTTGKEYVLPPDTITFTTPEGEDLSKVKPEYRANFAGEAGLAAAGLFHKLRWMKWMVDPETGEPITLAPKDIEQNFVMVGERKVTFKPKEVITGVARGQTGQRGTNAFELLGRGEVAMVTWFVQDLNSVGSSTGIDPDLLSWFPFPAANTPKGRQVVQVQNHYAVMVEAVGDRPKEDRDAVWKSLTAICDEQVRDDAIREKVLSGLARFVNPEDLTRLGLDDYLKDVPDAIRDNYRRIGNGEIAVFTEPYMGFWVTMDTRISTQVTSQIISEEGENFDYKAALAKVERDANSGLMFGRSQAELKRYRPYARVILLIVGAVMAFFTVLIVRTHLAKGKARKLASSRNVVNPIIPWLVLAPAILLIALWSYYPLLRGMVMAFQDYKIAGESPFIGVDNFINLALNGSFWMSLVRTVYFVFLNMSLAFCAPIVLALMLSEIPIGKYLYRTLFFLPQVTSGLVIALLWKLMYDSTPYGFLNQLLGLFKPLNVVFANWVGNALAKLIMALLLLLVIAFFVWLIYIFVAKRMRYTDEQGDLSFASPMIWVISAVPVVLVAAVCIWYGFRPQNLKDPYTLTVLLESLKTWYMDPVAIKTQTWLEDPKLAMLCCVIPTVWASMGMASLIYLAALKAVPEELYEAADVDGAGIFTKMRKITLPTLLPLVIINFVGAFIGTFQNMGNIFLMTFGGPGESTTVVGLLIWQTAYNDLKFSMATSMAWVLGSLLIGFTWFQIQFLKRVEFRKAEWD